MSEEQLRGLCHEWQEILGLTHWNVVIRSVRRKEMIASGNGCCSWTASSELALIQIVDSIDYDSTDFEQDIERTIVHELLHIVFGNWEDREDDSIVDILHEQAISRTAKALVNLKRSAGCEIMEGVVETLPLSSPSLNLKLCSCKGDAAS